MKEKHSLIKSLIEIIPLILFFTVNAIAEDGIIIATKVFVVTTIIAVSYTHLTLPTKA